MIMMMLGACAARVVAMPPPVNRLIKAAVHNVPLFILLMLPALHGRRSGKDQAGSSPGPAVLEHLPLTTTTRAQRTSGAARPFHQALLGCPSVRRFFPSSSSGLRAWA